MSCQCSSRTISLFPVFVPSAFTFPFPFPLPHYLHRRLRCKLAIKSELRRQKQKANLQSLTGLLHVLPGPRIMKVAGIWWKHRERPRESSSSSRSWLPFVIFMRLLFFIFSNFRLLIFPPPNVFSFFPRGLNFSHRKPWPGMECEEGIWDRPDSGKK